MKRISGSDEMHDRESLPLSRGRWIVIGRSRWSHVAAHYKAHRNAYSWIAIRRIRCIFCRFNLDRYDSLQSMVEIISHPVNSILPRTPLYLSEDRRLRLHTRSDTPHAATSPPHRDLWSRSDRMALIAPRHLCAWNNLKIQFLISKNP